MPTRLYPFPTTNVPKAQTEIVMQFLPSVSLSPRPRGTKTISGQPGLPKDILIKMLTGRLTPGIQARDEQTDHLLTRKVLNLLRYQLQIHVF